MTPSAAILLRHSVFLGLVRLQALRGRYPQATVDELFRANRAGPAQFSSADLLTAAEMPPTPLTIDLTTSGMRRFIDHALAVDPPIWLVGALRGRQALQAAMPAAARQCFEYAGVFAEAPTPEAIAWWDSLVSEQRSAQNAARVERGREGEGLTMKHEAARLTSIGISERPRWVALDDEQLGYDVLSFDRDSSGQVFQMLIEVKACSIRPLRFYLTRNEWRRAGQAQDAYCVHLWHLPTASLRILGWTELSDHVPVDQGAGLWQNVLVEP